MYRQRAPLLEIHYLVEGDIDVSDVTTTTSMGVIQGTTTTAGSLDSNDSVSIDDPEPESDSGIAARVSNDLLFCGYVTLIVNVFLVVH